MTIDMLLYVEACTGGDSVPAVDSVPDMAAILDRLYAGSPLAGTHLAIEPADRADARSICSGDAFGDGYPGSRYFHGTSRLDLDPACPGHDDTEGGAS